MPPRMDPSPNTAGLENTRALLTALEDLRESLSVRLGELSDAIGRLRAQAADLDRSLAGRVLDDPTAALEPARIAPRTRPISMTLNPRPTSIGNPAPGPRNIENEDWFTETVDHIDDTIRRGAARRAERIQRVRQLAGLPESTLINEDTRAGLLRPREPSLILPRPRHRRGLPPTNIGSRFDNQPPPIVVRTNIPSDQENSDSLCQSSGADLNANSITGQIPIPGSSQISSNPSTIIPTPMPNPQPAHRVSVNIPINLQHSSDPIVVSFSSLNVGEDTINRPTNDSLTYRGIRVANRISRDTPNQTVHTDDRWLRSWLLNRANAANNDPPLPPPGPANLQEARRLSQRRWPNGSPMEEEARQLRDENQQLRDLQRQMDAMRRNLNNLERRNDALASTTHRDTLFARTIPTTVQHQQMTESRNNLDLPARIPLAQRMTTDNPSRINRITPPSRPAVTVINTRRRRGPLRSGERYLSEVDPEHSILADYPYATIRIITDPPRPGDTVPPRPTTPSMPRLLVDEETAGSRLLERVFPPPLVDMAPPDFSMFGPNDSPEEERRLQTQINQFEAEIDRLVPTNVPAELASSEVEAENVMITEAQAIINNDNARPAIRDFLATTMAQLDNLDARAVQRREASARMIQRASETIDNANRLLADIEGRESEGEGPTVSSSFAAFGVVTGPIEVQQDHRGVEGFETAFEEMGRPRASSDSSSETITGSAPSTPVQSPKPDELDAHLWPNTNSAVLDRRRPRVYRSMIDL